MGFVIRATGGRVILIHVAKQNGYESCLLFSPEERSVKNVSKENAHGMQDELISKKAAIDAMAELQGRASTKAELKGISKALKRIKELPPIQPEPQYKTDYGFMWLCPKCGLPIHSDYTRCVRCGHNREKGV